MKLIDQHSATISLEKALLPASTLIDGRNERDWLSFLCEFASLINFYDNTNSKKGNWSPFLLKDPVLLLASISKTRFAQYHTPYLNACIDLEGLLQPKSPAGQTQNTAPYFNLVFDQLTAVFMCIKKWVYYMQKSPDEYDLKKYVIGHVRKNYSRYFWAVMSLRQNLFLNSIIPGIEPVDTSRFYFFDQNDERIWQENRNKSPYWEVLDLKHPLKENNEADILNTLQKAGDELFNFFHAIIKHAATEYDKLKTKQSRYPDTTLLRTFVHLLQTHQQQLNEMAKKHLHFYYRDILKQETLSAGPDKVFLYAVLSKKDAAFRLPANTSFDAGLDAQKKQVSFKTLEDVSLNPAAITGAYTLAKYTGGNGLSALFLQPVPSPGSIQTDEAGKVQSWETFGGAPANGTEPVTFGIAFASPLLLLREGQRTITLSLYFDGAIDIRLLQNAKYFLSTQTLWIEVQRITVSESAENGPVTIQLSLNATQPPIESFLTDPDGLNSIWPVLKIQFTNIPGMSQPPVLTKLDINVNVANLKTFQLYNDYGALSAKTSFQIFGSTPAPDSSFMIGNNEIFSKPVSKLVLGWDWDKLPDSFLTYYQEYNNYLAYQESLNQKRPSFFRRIWNWIRNIFRRKRVPVNAIPFNNICFTVDFDLLNEGSWQKIDMGNVVTVVDAANCIPSNEPDPVPPALINARELLFTVESSECALQGSSYFSYEALAPSNDNILPADPSIQNTPLKLSDTSSSGFLKMMLTGPVYGFGAELYPNVVTYTALQNAKAIARRRRNPQFIAPPNVPFAPKAKNLNATYTASQTYEFTGTQTAYPIQCFLYSPFANYEVYDNAKRSINYNYIIGNASVNAMQGTGIPLFHAFQYDGCLLLQMENLIAPNELNLYFELAGKAGATNIASDNQKDHFYLSTTGWKPLPVLSDKTKNITCSGILKVNVPADVATQSPVMPANKYWLAITSKGPAAVQSNTVLVQTNGFIAQRSSDISTLTHEAPRLNSASITKPQFAIPQIATVVQPFASFDGIAAETEAMMYRRISNRLKTKDRIVSAADYTSLIQQQFSDVFYSKPVFNQYTKNIDVYVVKAYENYTSASAFLPALGACSANKIQALLNDRVSAFSTVNVSNFDFQYVRITAAVSVKAGYEIKAVQKNINHALNLYLSPWISSGIQQAPVGQPVSDAQVAAFIKSIEGVMDVRAVLFQTLDVNAPKQQIEGAAYESSIRPLTQSILFVSYMDHVLNVTQQ